MHLLLILYQGFLDASTEFPVLLLLSLVPYPPKQHPEALLRHTHHLLTHTHTVMYYIERQTFRSWPVRLTHLECHFDCGFLFVLNEWKKKSCRLCNCTGLLGFESKTVSMSRSLGLFIPHHAWCVIEMRLGKYVCSGDGGGSFGKRVSNTAPPHILAKQAAPQPAPSIVNVRRRGRRRRRRRLRCCGSCRTQPTPAACSGCFAHLLIAFRFKLIKNHLSVIV